ncbi:hypothetical protein [Methylobacterium sp. E-045]|uniref:hypothetical protein n=1 Tax=Methylobacterium sp. E-045 TaxID=2836575 RepID=UPI001FB979A9|nr:hypothetical protein [Methylobacterium sp. E-045]MCJ2128004.1 hypothetical protein [Methylobacterium sp. E-045]
MTSITEPAEGQVLFPRRAPFFAMLAFLASFVGQVYWAGTYTTTIDNRITSLVESDQRITARSDERWVMLSGRLDSLERDRDRLPKLEERFGRVEEKLTMMIELLRETRQERRETRERGG